MPPPALPHEIHAFFEAYRDAFNALDGDAVAALYAEPSGIAQDGIYTHWPDPASTTQNMVALCALYRDKGYVHADFTPGVFIDQGPSHAVVDVTWRITWSAGQAPWCFRTTYNLMRTDQGWRVVLCTAYSEAVLHASTP